MNSQRFSPANQQFEEWTQSYESISVGLLTTLTAGLLEYVLAEQQSLRWDRIAISAVSVVVLWMVTWVWQSQLVQGPVTAEAMGDRGDRRWRTSGMAPSMPTHRASGLFVLVMFAPLLIDPFTRRWFELGGTSERLLLDGLRNLMVALFFLRQSRFCLQVSATCSLFLMLYLFAACFTPVSSVVLALYALIGLIWLTTGSTRATVLFQPVSSRAEVATRGSRILVGATLGVLLFLTTGYWTATRASHVLPGWFSSSGGTSQSDPFAYGGIGDGDQLVRGTERADSFGPVESQVFLESDQPSLYDMFNDLYEEAAPKDRSRKASIPLSPSLDQESRHLHAETQQAGREFSSVRMASKPRNRELEDRKSSACLYVDGRVPLHLAMEHYDHWDGRVLSQRSAVMAPPLYLMNVGEQRWLTWMTRFDGSLFPTSSLEEHTLRVIRLGSPRVPLPPQAVRLTVEHLHSTHLFQWTEDGALRFVADQLPPLTVLHLASPRGSLARLQETRFRQRLANDTDSDLQATDLPSEMDARVASLADRWAQGATSDWQVITNVVHSIRQHAALDATARVDETTDDAVADFLFRQRRGPDYLFAISTAVVLRHLGFDTRIASGFYADPQNYDRAAGRTVVHRDDLHFWVEVREPQGGWVTVDPTPGYEVLYEPLSLGMLLWQTVCDGLRWLGAHAMATSVSVVGFLVLFWRRDLLRKLLAYCRWHLVVPRDPRRRIALTLQLLETTSASARPTGRPVAHWIRSLRTAKGVVPEGQVEFARWCQWAFYSTRPQLDDGGRDVEAVCRQMVVWCWRSLLEEEQRRLQSVLHGLPLGKMLVSDRL